MRGSGVMNTSDEVKVCVPVNPGLLFGVTSEAPNDSLDRKALVEMSVPTNCKV